MKGLFSALGGKGPSTKPAGAAPGVGGGDGLVKEGSDRTFMTDVMEVSRAVPVIVDFWSARSGPCKQLSAILEKLVLAAKGAVRLVKIDVDRHQAIAGQLQVQSIPAVYAFFQGRPVDGFTGALPESQVKVFVDRVLKLGGGVPAGDGIAEALAEAKQLLEAGEAATAAEIYSEILAHEAGNAVAYAGLIRCLIAIGDLTRARKMVDSVPAEFATDKEIVAARTALEVADQGRAVGPLKELRAKVAADGADCQARFDLALACFADGQREAAIDELLEIIRRNRAWNEEQARKQLVKFFDVLGPTDPLTISSRRRLSSILFS
ncbi:MAG: co-chaperone YbbN [Rhodospirillaceae bacterium]